MKTLYLTVLALFVIAPLAIAAPQYIQSITLKDINSQGSSTNYFRKTGKPIDTWNFSSPLSASANHTTGVMTVSATIPSASELIAPANEGTFTISANQIASSSNSNVIETYSPTETGSAKWGDVFYQQSNTGSSRKNQVHGFGWNFGPNGGPMTSSEAMIGFSVESYYKPGEEDAVSEFHIYSQTNGGSGFRPLSYQFNRTDGTNSLSLSPTNLYIQGPGQSPTYWTWQAGDDGHAQVDLAAGHTAMYFSRNNATPFRQKDSLGNYVGLINVRDFDVVEVGDDTLPTMARGLILKSNSSKPECTGSPAVRGMQWATYGAPGVTDKIEICLKSAANSYNWIEIKNGG